MAKLPNHCYQRHIFVSHPSVTLRSAAKWLEIDAAAYRKERNKDGARVLMKAAAALRVIADGQTPAEAFDFPPQFNQGEKA